MKKVYLLFLSILSLFLIQNVYAETFDGEYSVEYLLRNYNLVTLGHKQLDSKSNLLQFGNTPGSVRLFHITGPALINGDLYGKVYDGVGDDYYYNYYDYHIQENSQYIYLCVSNKKHLILNNQVLKYQLQLI